MRKFKCESDFMRESTRIYRAYVEKEKQLNDLIAETNSLKDLTNEAKERETKKIQHEISEKRAGMKTLLSNLENDFADWAFEFADLTGEGLDRKLATALSSGISYSPQDCCILPKKPEIIKLTHAYYMTMRNLTVMSLKIMFHQIRKLKSSTR